MLVRDIEQALSLVEETGYEFGQMALSKGALVRLCRNLELGQRYRFLELGGGQSTLFWQALRKLNMLQPHVITLEHQPDWAKVLQGRLGGDEEHSVVLQGLKQISDDERQRMFEAPEEAAGLWDSIGDEVPESQYSSYTIRNTFYSRTGQLDIAPGSIDALIVDGPHGNGRSLAFPIFSSALKEDAWVLIDDFDHYPFLDDLGRIFAYEEQCRETAGGKRWTLVRLYGRRRKPA